MKISLLWTKTEVMKIQEAAGIKDDICILALLLKQVKHLLAKIRREECAINLEQHPETDDNGYY